MLYKMMFLRCSFLLSLITAYRTAEAYDVNKDPDSFYIIEKILPPAFCNDLECPKFQLVKKYSGFEHRKYKATQWISTVIPLHGKEPSTGYVDLCQYRDGSNSEGYLVENTVPLLMMVALDKGRPVNVTMSIFLPEHIKDPPKPLKSTIFLQKFPEASIYVRSFGGFASDKDYTTHGNALIQELTRLGLRFDFSFYGYNVYDPKSKKSNRHNEVWYLAI